MEEYCAQIKSTLIDERLRGKFTPDDKVVLLSVHREGLEVSKRPENNVDVYEFSKALEDVESKFKPIMTKIKKKEKQHLEDFAKKM